MVFSFAVLVHLPNALVWVVGDKPHPYVGLQRMLAVQQGVPMAQQPDYNQLVNWFVATCHQGPSSLSLVSQQWMRAQHASAEVISWAQAKHDQLLPPPSFPIYRNKYQCFCLQVLARLPSKEQLQQR